MIKYNIIIALAQQQVDAKLLSARNIQIDFCQINRKGNLCNKDYTNNYN